MGLGFRLFCLFVVWVVATPIAFICKRTHAMRTIWFYLFQCWLSFAYFHTFTHVRSFIRSPYFHRLTENSNSNSNGNRRRNHSFEHTKINANILESVRICTFIGFLAKPKRKLCHSLWAFGVRRTLSIQLLNWNCFDTHTANDNIRWKRGIPLAGTFSTILNTKQKTFNAQMNNVAEFCVDSGQIAFFYFFYVTYSDWIWVYVCV